MLCFCGNCSKNLDPADSADVYSVLTICQGFLYILKEALFHFRNKKLRLRKLRKLPQATKLARLQNLVFSNQVQSFVIEPSWQAFQYKDEHHSKHLYSSTVPGVLPILINFISITPQEAGSIMYSSFTS